MKLLAWDTETFRIGAPHPDKPGVDIFPKLVCLTSAYRDENGNVVKQLWLPWENDIETQMGIWLDDPEVHHVLANANYDEHVVQKEYPRLISKFWRTRLAGRIHDIQINEKLKYVAYSGQVYTAGLPDGSMVRLSHSLAELEKRYLGRDRTAEKGDDSWRLNYNLLHGWARENWPEEAVKYALDDAEGTLLVAEQQGIGTIPTSDFRCPANYALGSMTANGIGTDGSRFYPLQSLVEEHMQAHHFPTMVNTGVLAEAVPPQPYKNGAQDHEEDCENFEKKGKKAPCDCPVKMTAGTDEKISTKGLKNRVLQVCLAQGVPVELTETGRKDFREETHEKLKELPADHEWWSVYPKTISTEKGFLSKLTPFDDVLAEYAERQEWAKLKSTYLPQLLYKEGDEREGQLADRVHFNYDIVKETGRTSSFAGRLYPSGNGQNMDPRIRPCYKARPGHVICSWDYSSLELVSLAQTCLNLFGFSRMAELLQMGVDLHAYLGAQLAYAMDEDFRAVADQRFNQGSRMDYYEMFKAYEDHDFEFYDHWRTFAKPVGLGYPGGLGAETMVAFAWSPYGVKTTPEECVRMKEIWLATYPEMSRYFQYVNDQCIDPAHKYIDDDGNEKPRYRYTTPFGMLRSNASYTAACNGLGMQSPSAEGALMAVCLVVRACEDPAAASILYGAKPFNFVHDEILVEIPYDEDPVRATKMCAEIGKLMVHGMKQVITDIPVKGDPAIMRNWFKKAKEVRKEGVLIPWDEAYPEKASA